MMNNIARGVWNLLLSLSNSNGKKAGRGERFKIRVIKSHYNHYSDFWTGYKGRRKLIMGIYVI